MQVGKLVGGRRGGACSEIGRVLMKNVGRGSGGLGALILSVNAVRNIVDRVKIASIGLKFEDFFVINILIK